MLQDKETRLLQWNVMISMFGQILSLAINLISKRAIWVYLNVEYLGLQGLYSNFCDMLSFAYFGAGTAMLFSFYGPMARKDKERLAVLYQHYDRIYRKMTGIIFGIGTITTVLAVFSVNADIGAVEIIITFLTYMSSIVIYNRYLVRSYFIQADQKKYFVSAVTSGIDFAALLIEVLVLKFLRSYEVFILCIVIKNICINYAFGRYLKKHYGFLRRAGGVLEKKDAKEIKTNMSDMVMYCFGKTLISNTDNIFISYLINTAMVGIYSNYQFIMYGITSLIAAFYEAITARVGQLASISRKEKQYAGFQLYSFINSWLTGMTIVCFYYLIQDFIVLWMGKVEQLPEKIIWIIIINYYLDTCRYATKTYRESAGLFKNIKQIIWVKGIINIILSFIMGKIWGLSGILIATTIASAVTLFWYEPVVVYRYFNQKVRNEIVYQASAILQMAASFLITGFAVRNLPSGGLAAFAVKLAVCGLAANSSYFVFYFIYKKLAGTKDER